MRKKLIHVGNDISQVGGISSVIRRHISRKAVLEMFEMDNIATYSIGDSAIRGIFRAFAACKEIGLSKADVCHIHFSNRFSYVREGIILGFCRIKRIPTVSTFHGSNFMYENLLVQLLQRFMIRNSDKPHFISEFHFRKKSALNSNSINIPNDADNTDQRCGLSANGPLIFVGEIGIRKGVDLLLEAWSDNRLKDLELLVVGEVDKTDYKFDDHPSNVKFTGKVSPSVVESLMLASQLLILPSRNETFPMVIVEALRIGLPVLSSEIPEIANLIDESGQARVPLDSKSLTDAVLSIAGCDETLKKMQSEGLAYFRKNLSADIVSDVWLKVYVELSDEK